MTSQTYNTIRAAMEARQQVICTYQGYEREICFHCIGYGIDRGEKALGFQFAGGSSKGLPPEGQWRCLDLGQLQNARPREGAWHSGQKHAKPQSCVKDVHFEVRG
jgi:hypothetical protein